MNLAVAKLLATLVVSALAVGASVPEAATSIKMKNALDSKAVTIADELTIIANSASESILYLEPGHPARPYIADIENAVQRCIWKASGLLTYSTRRGVRPVSASMERIVSESE